jgi:hypothetical protein
MNWQEEILRLIQEHYKNIGIKYKATDSVQRCLIDYMNLEMKLIKPLQRAVYKSEELKARRIPVETRRALNYIENKIRAGVDINHHKNKGSLDPKFKDLLLNDWGIHHFHLSDTKAQKNQRFYDRTKLVLLAVFNETQAFLIDIRAHGENGEPYVFAKKELLETLDKNWPGILVEHDAEDVMHLLHNPSDEEIERGRECGVTFGMTEINGKVIINPGLGITTGKHNIHVVSTANSIMRFVQESLMQIDNDEEGMKKALSEKAGFEIKELDLRINRQATWPYFYVYEKNSDCTIERNYEQ